MCLTAIIILLGQLGHHVAFGPRLSYVNVLSPYENKEPSQIQQDAA